jgi:hypothetical protein
MLMIKNAGMEYSLGQVEIFTKETILMMWDTDLDKCIGMMEVVIKVIGKKVFNMDKVVTL